MVEVYPAALVVLGLAIFGAVVLPRLLADRPLSLPIIYVAGGVALFSLPVGVDPPGMIENSMLVERLSELVVIVALMGAGLKIDRPFSVRGWTTTWRLLGVTMPLTIAATVAVGWGILGLHPATAVLLGAVVAPTDPVLASDIASGPPLTAVEEEDTDQDVGGEEEHGTRFALTSEAGLNDGLAFPFTNLAIVLAAVGVSQAGGTGPGFYEAIVWWGLWDVGYKIVVGVVAGAVMGYVGALVIFRLPASSHVARTLAGAEALSGTFVIYGVTELVHGYGFIAVFVGALVLRHFEWQHDYYRTLNDYAVMVERLVMAVVLVTFGGAIAGGLLTGLTVPDVVVGLVILFLIRPLSGIVGLLGSELTWQSRGVVAVYGIRGIGSFYYLSHALNESSFQEFELLVAADRLWALTGFVVLVSILVHGVTASPVMNAFEQWAAVRDDSE